MVGILKLRDNTMAWTSLKLRVLVITYTPSNAIAPPAKPKTSLDKLYQADHS